MKVPDAWPVTLAAETSTGIALRTSCCAGTLRELLHKRFPDMTDQEIEEAIWSRVARDECNSDN